MLLFFTFISLLIIALFYSKIEWGVSLLVFFIMCVSVKKVIIGNLFFPYTCFYVALIPALYIFLRKKKCDFYSVNPFLYIFLLLLILIPIETDMPYVEQLKYWILEALPNLVLPFAIWNICKYKRASFLIMNIFLLISIAINTLYGLVLTQLGGLNPYLILTLPISGEEFDLSYSIGESAGRMFGRISSTFSHPMTFGLFLSLSFWYVLFNKINFIIKLILLITIILMIVFCGSRTPIATIMFVFFYYVYKQNLGKSLLLITGLVIVSFVVFCFFPQIYEYIFSIVSPDKADVGGSSLDMRIEQLKGCFIEIRDCILFGHGYRWNLYYQSIHGNHPIILAFESLIFVILCNWGLFGIIAWIIFLFLLIKLPRRLISQKYWINMDVFVLTYFIYSIITGEYKYMEIFNVFYMLSLSFYYNEKTKNIITTLCLLNRFLTIKDKI